MNKKQFISKLNRKLSDLPKREREERINFYSEMIDDRVEEGKTEDQAINEIGDIDEIITQIRYEKFGNDDSRRFVKRQLRTWEIFLLILSSPIWFSLLLAASILIFVLFFVVWICIITLWIVELPFFIFEYISKGLFWSCKKTTKGGVMFTKGGAAFIKKFFTVKGDK